MRRRLCPALCLAALLFALLAGCTGEGYSKKEAEDLEMKGIRMMSSFLSEHTERGIVMVADPLEEFVYGGRDRLTEYVEGTYSDVDGVWEYRINTETGEVYTSRHWAELEELVGRQALEACALPPEAAIEKLEISQYMLPHEQPELMNVPETAVWGAPVLPFGVEAADYLRAAGDRDVIQITKFQVSLPEGTDLSQLHLESMSFEWNGVTLERLTASNGAEEVSASGRSLRYERWEQWEDGEFVLLGVTEHRWEFRDGGSGEIGMERKEFDLGEVRAETAENGWITLRLGELNGDENARVRLFVRDGSEYLQYKYAAFYSDGDFDYLKWSQSGDGLWELCIAGPQYLPGFGEDAEMRTLQPDG